MDKKDQLEELALLVKAVNDAVKACTDFADEYQLDFALSIGEASNADRDIGGRYYPEGLIVDADSRYSIETEYGRKDYYCNEDVGVDKWGDPLKRLNEGRWSAWQSSSEEC